MNTNHERPADVITHEATGTTRVAFAPKDPQGGNDHVQRALNASDRVQTTDHSNNASFLSVTIGGTQATDGNGRITHATTQAGMGRSGADISANDLITVDGVQMRLRDAVAAGIARHNSDGSYSLVGKR